MRKIIENAMALFVVGLLIVILGGCSLLPKDPYGSNKEFFDQRTRWGY